MTDDSNEKSFGEILKDERGSRPQWELAKELKVNQSVVSSWENNISFPREDRLLELKKIYKWNDKVYEEHLKVIEKERKVRRKRNQELAIEGDYYIQRRKRLQREGVPPKLDYRILHKIEDRYGALRNCPEDSEELQLLRSSLHVTSGKYYNST